MGTKDTRDRLKKRFENGTLPSQGDFEALIESLVHVDEFDAWKLQGMVDIGSGKDRRWRLQSINGQLVLGVSDSTVQPGDPSQVQFDAWVGMPARRGTYKPAGADGTPRCVVADGGPPGALQVKADGAWHPVVRDVAAPAAFEVVAQLAEKETSRPGRLDRVLRDLGVKTTGVGLLHAVAVSAGRGTTPSLTQTLAPSRRGRSLVGRFAAACTLAGVLLAVYAAYRVPGTACGAVWGIRSCLPALFDAQRGLMLLGIGLVLVSIAAGVLLLTTSRSGLQLAWRASSQGDTHDLCVRAPSTGQDVKYHLTRLW